MFGADLSPSEILGLGMCFLVLFYVVVNRRTLLRGRYVPITYGFLCVLGAFLCTNLEEFFLEDLLNVIEHALMATGALLVTLGCRRALDAGKQGDEAP